MAPSNVVDYVEQTPIVNLATERRSGGEAVTPIWGVVVDGVPYIRSGYGSDSLWYRRVQRTHRAAVVDGDTRYPVSIQNLDDEPTIREVDRAYAEKYASEPGSVRQMVSPEVRGFTMRLMPR